MNDEFGTFYKINILYRNVKFNVEKSVEYHLSKKINKYYYYKFSDNKLVYVSNEFRSNHMIKNIYHIMQNIEKLNDGKIKKYMISSQLELEVLCDFLKKSNILHRIKLEYSKNVVGCFLFPKEIDIDLIKTYFNHYSSNYETNKVIKIYKLYIEVYKGFTNLFDKKYMYQNSDVKTEIDKPKFGIYLYPDWKALGVRSELTN